MRARKTPPIEEMTFVDAQGASLIYAHEGELYYVPADKKRIDPKPPFSSFWRYLMWGSATATGLMVIARGVGWLAGIR